MLCHCEFPDFDNYTLLCKTVFVFQKRHKYLGVKTHVCNFLSNGSRKKNVCVFLDKDDYASAIKKKKKDLGNLGEEQQKRNSSATVAAFYTKIQVKGEKSDNNIIVLYSCIIHSLLASPS